MKKNKAKQMLLSLGLMATVASPLVTVISCGESDETAPEITVDQKTALDGETVQGSGTEYTLSLTQGTTVTQETIEGLFTVEDEMDEDVTLTYTWETGPFEAATTGECVLTISSEDAAGNSVTYTLTITVSPPEVEGVGSGTGETGGLGSGGGENLDTTAPVLAATGTLSGAEAPGGDATAGYTLGLTTDTVTTVTEVEALFTATDGTDKVVKVNVVWETTPTDFTTAGTYVATLTATDVAGNKAEVTLTVTVSDLTAADKTVTVTQEDVEGLVSFTGTDGAGSVQIGDTSDLHYTLTYESTLDGNLSNGNTVTFTVEPEEGYTLGDGTATFEVTVSGLNKALDMSLHELKDLVSVSGEDGAGTLAITDVEGDGYVITLASVSTGHDADGQLKNGDVLTFTVTTEAGYELGTTPDSFTVTVSDLTAADKTVTVTQEDVEGLVSFTGTDGAGSVQIGDTSDLHYTLTYESTLDGNLSNGNTVTFTVEPEEGYTLGDGTATFEVTVSGLIE